MAYSIDWLAIHAIDRWLDSAVSEEYIRQPMAQDWARISKVGEEYGEAVQAFIGYTGQNPRKGVINSREEVLEELADTALTAILAIQHFTKNTALTKEIIRNKVKKIEKRVPINEPAEDDLWAGKGFIP
jgi:hypothetical protein